MSDTELRYQIPLSEKWEKWIYCTINGTSKEISFTFWEAPDSDTLNQIEWWQDYLIPNIIESLENIMNNKYKIFSESFVQWVKDTIVKVKTHPNASYRKDDFEKKFRSITLEDFIDMETLNKSKLLRTVDDDWISYKYFAWYKRED